MLFLCFPMYRNGEKIARDLIDHQHTLEPCCYSKINFILMKISWKVYQHKSAPRISPFAVSSGDEFSVFPPRIQFYLLTLVTSPHFRLFSEQLLCFMYSWPRFQQISLTYRAKRRHSMPKQAFLWKNYFLEYFKLFGDGMLHYRRPDCLRFDSSCVNENVNLMEKLIFHEAKTVRTFAPECKAKMILRSRPRRTRTKRH